MMPQCLRRWLHRAALLWREDASPKKSHPNGGEEAMLVETIPPALLSLFPRCDGRGRKSFLVAVRH